MAESKLEAELSDFQASAVAYAGAFKEATPETQAQMRREFLQALMIGFLRFPDPDPEVFEDELLLELWTATRAEPIEQARQFIQSNPDLPALAKLQCALEKVNAAHDLARQQDKRMEHQAAAIYGVLQWVYTRPEVDEEFAQEVLEQSDLLV